MISQLVLKRSQWHEMHQHVEQHAPLEACGLLAGENGIVENVLLVRNRAESPVRFVMDPQEQLDAFAWIASQALDLLGIFHSHPAGPETPSATDIAEAAYEAVHVVWSRTAGAWTACGFWIENGRVINIPLILSET